MRLIQCLAVGLLLMVVGCLYVAIVAQLFLQFEHSVCPDYLFDACYENSLWMNVVAFALISLAALFGGGLISTLSLILLPFIYGVRVVRGFMAIMGLLTMYAWLVMDLPIILLALMGLAYIGLWAGVRRKRV